jgi:hypothetical protein
MSDMKSVERESRTDVCDESSRIPFAFSACLLYSDRIIKVKKIRRRLTGSWR